MYEAGESREICGRSHSETAFAILIQVENCVVRGLKSLKHCIKFSSK
jgi:hypothetical protein